MGLDLSAAAADLVRTTFPRIGDSHQASGWPTWGHWEVRSQELCTVDVPKCSMQSAVLDAVSSAVRYGHAHAREHQQRARPLEPLKVINAPHATHLRYRIVK